MSTLAGNDYGRYAAERSRVRRLLKACPSFTRDDGSWMRTVRVFASSVSGQQITPAIAATTSNDGKNHVRNPVSPISRSKLATATAQHTDQHHARNDGGNQGREHVVLEVAIPLEERDDGEMRSSSAWTCSVNWASPSPQRSGSLPSSTISSPTCSGGSTAPRPIMIRLALKSPIRHCWPAHG